METKIAYKAFDKDLKCRGFAFEAGREYTQDGEIKAGRNGFHACAMPLDVFDYYPPAGARLGIVELAGEIDVEDNKSAAQCIKIVRELTLAEFINCAVESIKARATGDQSASNATGDRSASSATGYQSASSATGDQSASSATGDRSASSATGYQSASSATGDQSASSATGYRSASSATGDRSASSATGYRSASSATGDQSASSATGDQSASSATGLGALAVATGGESKAMAGQDGAGIVLVHRDSYGNIQKILTGIAGVDIKAGVWYTVSEAGELVECSQ